MKVLYIDHYAGSNNMGMEFRPFYLANEWKKSKNINTTILAADYSHLRKENPNVEKDLEIQKIEGVEYIFLKTNKYNGNGIKRVISMFEFVSKGIFHAKRISELINPDIVICSSTYPLDTYIGQKIAKLSNAKLIHEIHDLWPLTPMELGGYSSNHPFIKVLQIAEKSAYKNSAFIVSILPHTEPYVRSLGINTKVVNIPNGLLNEEFKDKSTPNKEVVDLVNKLHNEDKFIVGYAGGISVSNAMDDFISALIELKNTNIASIIIGDGILLNELKEIKVKEQLDNVYFVGKIPKTEIISTLKYMDSLYIGSKKSKLYEFGVSANKIFDYLLTGKPIINAFDTKYSPMNFIGNTIECEAENPKQIAEGIIKASKLTKEQKERISKESIDYVMKNHGYEKLAKDFSNLFN